MRLNTSGRGHCNVMVHSRNKTRDARGPFRRRDPCQTSDGLVASGTGTLGSLHTGGQGVNLVPGLDRRNTTHVDNLPSTLTQPEGCLRFIQSAEITSNEAQGVHATEQQRHFGLATAYSKSVAMIEDRPSREYTPVRWFSHHESWNTTTLVIILPSASALRSIVL